MTRGEYRYKLLIAFLVGNCVGWFLSSLYLVNVL